MMIVFRTEEKNYCGSSALEIVRALESDSQNYPYRGQSLRHFLSWSLGRLGNCIPPREIDLSDRMEDEALALNYLCLRDEYGVETHLSNLPYECSAWLVGPVDSFKKPYSAVLAKDAKGRPVVLFTSPWDKRSAAEKNPEHQLLDFA